MNFNHFTSQASWETPWSVQTVAAMEIKGIAGEPCLIFGRQSKFLSQQKWRDVLKMLSVKSSKYCYYVVVGLENQTEMHDAIAVRDMQYDAINYARQIRRSRHRHWQEEQKTGIGDRR